MSDMVEQSGRSAPDAIGSHGTVAGASVGALNHETTSRPVYDGARCIERAHSIWAGVDAIVDEVHSDATLATSLASDKLQLCFVMAATGGQFDIRTRDGDRQRVERRGALSLIPAGVNARGEGRPLGYLKLMRLRIDEAGEEGGLAARAPQSRLMFEDETLSRLCRLLAEECGGAPSGRLYAESLATAFKHRLSQFSAVEAPADFRGRLAPWQLRRATEYLRHHLSEEAPLQALADLTRLSRSYFCRAFRASTGMSPHQWFLNARIEEAKRLLVEGREPLCELSLAFGFTDQAHFGRTFRRVAGVTPGAWRRQKGLARSVSERRAGSLIN